VSVNSASVAYTNTMPVSTARSSVGLRPANWRLRGARAGSSGSISDHNLLKFANSTNDVRWGVDLHGIRPPPWVRIPCKSTTYKPKDAYYVVVPHGRSMAPMVAFPIDLFAHCSDSQSTKHAIDLHSQGEWDIASPPLFRLSRSGASEECRSRS